MKDLRLRLATAMLGMALLLLGCGTPAPDRSPQGTSGTANGTARLQTDMLLAATLAQFGQGNAAQGLSYAAMAAQKAPERADVAWLHSRLCTLTPGCEPEPLEARLRKLQPENAAAWLGALARAQERPDRAAENHILEAIGRAERVDFYWNSLVSRTAVALNDSGFIQQRGLNDGLTESLNQAVGWMSSLASTALRSVTTACSPQRTTDREHALRCARAAEVLLRSDSYLAEGVGLGIAERVLSPSSAGANAIAEQIRLSRYQRDTAGQIIAAQVEKAQFSAEMIKLMRKLRREQDVFLAVIRWAGEPVDPPPGAQF